MILNSIASSKQSKGMTEQADYVKSKLPGKEKAPAVPDVPVESLQKYTGEYDYSSITVKVVLKDNKTLNLLFTGQPDMELTPVSKAKFAVKYMEGYSVVFTTNDKDEVTELVFSTPGG